MSDLNRLLELTEQVRVPAFDDVLSLQQRRSRRVWVAVASVAAATVLATVGALAATGGIDRSDAPPVDRLPTPTPSETVVVPEGQSDVTVDIAPGDIRGWDVLATVTNSQPAHRGSTFLEGSATVRTDAASGDNQIVSYCRGNSDLWLVRREFPDGGYGFDQCSPTADTSLCPVSDIPEWTARHFEETTSARLYVARPTQAWADGYKACYRKGEEDCVALFGPPQPLADPPAEFGFRIYEHPWMPRVLTLFGTYEFEALSTIHGAAWLIDRAVVAGPSADRLALELPAKEREFLVDVYALDAAHLARCAEQHADELPGGEPFGAYESALDEICGVDLRLVVDGTAISPAKNQDERGHFMELGAELSRGINHQVVVEVVRGDPRNIQYAVVVRVDTEMP